MRGTVAKRLRRQASQAHSAALHKVFSDPKSTQDMKAAKFAEVWKDYRGLKKRYKQS